MKDVVYIIDDVVSVREGVGDLLRSVGLEVQTFPSGQEFLEIFSPEAFDQVEEPFESRVLVHLFEQIFERPSVQRSRLFARI